MALQDSEALKFKIQKANKHNLNKNSLNPKFTNSFNRFMYEDSTLESGSRMKHRLELEKAAKEK